MAATIRCDRLVLVLIIATALTGRAERVLERTFRTVEDYNACTRDVAIPGVAS